MKFFIIVLSLIALSNSLSLNWIYLYGVPSTLEPFHLLFGLYSKPQTQLPRNDVPNTFYPVLETLVGEGGKIGKSIREHWGIENSLHWVLDVAFGEDKSRKRSGHAAQNFSIINRIALNLLKNEPKKRSVKGKRLDAGWNNNYLIKILKN